MASPNLPVQFPLPDQEQPKTYDEIVDSLTCPPCGGAQIRPSGLPPTGTINIGDAIADITSHLTSFTNAYSIILAILKMIACIIEVICAMSNPFAVIPAVIRLFGVCLPEFILIFPLFTIPCIILCFIKIMLAIIEYILTVIVPVIEDIIQNIQDLIAAFTQNNADAQAAVAFKIASLIRELYTILGILAVLGAIFTMIKALLALGLGIPCGGAGGACFGCGDDQCPSTIQNDDVSGTDGVLTVLFSVDGINFTIRFTSVSSKSSFTQLRDFFPSGIDYSVVEEEEIPYTLTVDGNTFAVTSIDSSGALSLQQIQTERLDDGYVSTTTSTGTLVDPYIRFGTDTATFSASMVSVLNPRYVDIQETRSTASDNTGAWKIVEFYDEYNVRLEKTDPSGSPTWSGTNTASDPDPFLLWRLAPTAPTAGSGKTFNLDINHEELIRRDIIGLGCHPAIKASRDGVVNRFPEFDFDDLPDLPDLDDLISALDDELAKVAPQDVDADYVLDNYDTINDAIQDLDLSALNDYGDELVEYSKLLCPRVFDPENSTIEATPSPQIIGDPIIVQVTPLNRSGTPLAFDLPPGVIEVEIDVSSGSITTPVELLDSNGDPTGVFQSELNKLDPGVVTITASVCDRDIADFNGAELITRLVEVEFILSDDKVSKTPAVEGEVSVEPLGKGSPE